MARVRTSLTRSGVRSWPSPGDGWPTRSNRSPTGCRWPEAVREFACRVGLVMCGDLAAAIRCILRFEGWRSDFETPETREHITRIDLLGRLVRFAFSEEYLKPRYEVGLTATPDELSI